MMPTKYAEWVDLPCGKCRFLIDIGTILEWQVDPTCIGHETAKCLVCGELVQRAVSAHGTVGNSHATKFVEEVK